MCIIWSPALRVDNDSSRMFTAITDNFSHVCAFGRHFRYDSLYPISEVKQSSFSVQCYARQLRLWVTCTQSLSATNCRRRWVSGTFYCQVKYICYPVWHGEWYLGIGQPDSLYSELVKKSVLMRSDQPHQESCGADLGECPLRPYMRLFNSLLRIIEYSVISFS